MPKDRRPILRLGHSPDPDDAFMWWPLFEGDSPPTPPAIDTGRFRFVPVAADIESLNQRAEGGGGDDADLLEITAISCAQYPAVQDRYALTACGSSMGERYGPKLVASQPMKLDELRNPKSVLAIPGERTSAFVATSIMLGKDAFAHESVPFDQIIPRVAAGEFAAGLVIHEGQLTYAEAGLHLIEDVGEWWWRQHKLPLPLGVNAVRRDLERLHGAGTLKEIAALLARSIRYALEHREAAIGHALKHARGMGAALADEFVGMYVNDLTVDMGARGRQAVQVFLEQAHLAGLTPRARIDVIDVS